MTPLILSRYADLTAAEADTIIDVRSAAEFAEDHLPGAINLPVLDDRERAEVGTLYTQQSPFDARKIGAALVARNTATHLQGALADKPGHWRPLVYCWRGGQRSGSFATILGQIGWRVQLLKGGYQSYRRLVSRCLYDDPLPHRLMLIQGGTGTAKTALLDELAQQGAQVLDLEGLAQHRGSLFGAMPGGQPSQKMFESRLAAALDKLDPAQLTWVEAESNKIGARLIPPSLWSVMRQAPRVEILAPLAARVAFLCRAYGDLTQDRQRLLTQIEQLRGYHANDQIDQWQTLAQSGAFAPLAQSLIEAHYDPRYTKSAERSAAPLAQQQLPDLAPADLRQAARDLRSKFSAG